MQNPYLRFGITMEMMGLQYAAEQEYADVSYVLAFCYER